MPTTGELTDFAHLTVGEHVTVLAESVNAETKGYRPKSGNQRMAYRTSVTVTDGNRTAADDVLPAAVAEQKLTPGTVALFSGKVELFNGRMQLAHPAGSWSTAPASTSKTCPSWLRIGRGAAVGADLSGVGSSDV